MTKKGKTFICIMLLIFLCLLLGACKYEVYKEGIENFNKNDSNMSINQGILPSDDFVDLYEYTNAEYYYSDVNEHLFYIANLEQSIVIMNYDEEVYEEAKAYCLDNMDLSEVNKFEYDDYMFVENVGLAKGMENFKDGVNTRFPYQFNMFAYNDDESCLLFMGFYSSTDRHDENINLAETDWGAFLDMYFSQYYDFKVE